MPRQHDVFFFPHPAQGGGEQGGQEQDKHAGDRPQVRGRQQHPAQRQQKHKTGRDQAAAQIVQDLRARQRRQGRSASRARGRRRAAEQPAQQLPVSPYPTVPAADVRGVAGGLPFE
ncbi:hypothetical protein D3C87_1120920 [compost metagenome]